MNTNPFATNDELPPFWESGEFSSADMETACKQPLHHSALAGLRLFNSGLYFEAHEALESAWREEKGPARELYRGILQVAVGYYHLLRGNHRGALKMFARARGWLTPFPDNCRGVDVSTLLQDFERVENELLRLGPDHLDGFKHSLLKPIVFKEISLL
jgi:uncharacterized protein